MSKLIDKVEATLTGERRAAMPALNYVCIKESYTKGDPLDIDYQCGYHVGVTFGSNTWGFSRDIPRLKTTIARAIQEEVFGEFRKPIIEAKRALLECDYSKALESIEKLEQEMFSI